MLNAVSRAAIMASGSGPFMWRHIESFVVSKGAKEDFVRRVRALRDLGLLEPDLLLLWSDWFHIDDRPGGLAEMQNLIQEDFGGIGMVYQREDLIKRLDHILEPLASSLVPIEDLVPAGNAIQSVKERYEELRRLLLEVDGEAVKILSRTSPWLIRFGLLTPGDVYRVSLNLHVRSTSPVPITSRLEGLALFSTSNNFAILALIVIDIVAFHHTLAVASVSPSPKAKLVGGET